MKNTEIEILKKKIEEKFGSVPNNPDSFQRLSEDIYKACNENLSESTLKRLWGYVKGGSSHRESSLDVLASYLGYENYRSFCKDLERSSSFLCSETVLVSDIVPGSVISLKWGTDRKVTLKYEGDELFRVIDAGKSKLASGDIFHCKAFYSGQPLYVSDIVRGEELLPPYVAGKTGGIEITEITAPR